MDKIIYLAGLLQKVFYVIHNMTRDLIYLFNKKVLHITQKFDPFCCVIDKESFAARNKCIQMKGMGTSTKTFNCFFVAKTVGIPSCHIKRALNLIYS